MKKWEYKFDTLEYYHSVHHQEHINERGEEGWELVSSFMVETNRLRMYWKREQHRENRLTELGIK